MTTRGESYPPQGTFRGTNIMTPEWLGYAKLRDGEGWAELTTGRDLNEEPIFGVTVRHVDGQDRNQRSKMFWSRAEAVEYIKSLGGSIA